MSLGRIFRPEFLMDCLLVGLVGATSMFIYTKVSGLTLKAESVEKNYLVQKLKYDDYEFLMLVNKLDPQDKVVIKLNDPDYVCQLCKKRFPAQSGDAPPLIPTKSSAMPSSTDPGRQPEKASGPSAPGPKQAE